MPSLAILRVSKTVKAEAEKIYLSKYVVVLILRSELPTKHHGRGNLFVLPHLWYLYRTISMWALRIGTVTLGIALYSFETNDVGITEAVTRLWHA